MKKERLYSLDCLRGLDMLFLTVFAPLFYALDGAFHLPKDVMVQFSHPYGGFTLYDIIMPLFIFMAGAAVPFALGKRLGADGKPTREYWTHVLARFALLWVLGMVSQGHLLTYDWRRIVPYNNTLQTIACGYLIAAIVFPLKNKFVRYLLPVVMTIIYQVPVSLYGNFTKLGSLPWKIDLWIFDIILPTGSVAVAKLDPGFSWFFTSLMFGTMTLCGMFATEALIKEGDKKKKGLQLFLGGVALLVLGLVLEIFVPCIKHIYTASFTAQAMGWSVIFLAILYYITDVLQFRKGTYVLVLYGQTALAAYMVGDIFRGQLGAFSNAFTAGLGPLWGNSWRIMANWLVFSILLTLCLRWWRAAKIGLKSEKK